MRSDQRLEAVLALLEPPFGDLRSAIAAAVEEVRGWLLAHEMPVQSKQERAALELGPFAQGRISAERFAALSAAGTDSARVDRHAVERVRAALEVLNELAAAGTGLAVCEVPRHRSLADRVDRALARIGRAFGAARAVERTRGGGPPADGNGRMLEAFPFRHWNRGERGLAPPLVVLVEGDDLRVGGLSDYLDGNQKIVLLVTGEAPPASLVRLITPRTFVIQTADVAELEQLFRHGGPGVAALVGADTAHFVHDPARGDAPWQRLAIKHLPDPPRKTVAGLSAAQQLDELHQLKALAERPPESVAAAAGGAGGGTAAAAAPAAPDPVDALASWLLGQADLSDVLPKP